MIENDLKLNNAFFFGRTDIAEDDELLGLLRDAGFRIILVGFESLNQKALDSINKKQKVEDIIRCAKKLSEYKIRISTSIVLGLDLDTLRDMKNTIHFVKKLHSYSFQPPPLTAYPGSVLFANWQMDNRIITRNWDHFDMMHVVFRPKHITALQLQKLFFKALKNFYSLSSAIASLFCYGPLTFLKRLSMAFIVKYGLVFFKIFEQSYYKKLKQASKVNNNEMDKIIMN